MSRITVAWRLFSALALTLLAGCGGGGGSSGSAPAPNPDPLSANNINLIFVVSEDLAYQAPGDINPATANLTNQGLRRSLQMAGFLRQSVLGRENVTGIYVIEPMTHLQTADNHPDIVSAETVQQFALLNQMTLSSTTDTSEYIPYTGNSYPLNASYAKGSVPTAVATPEPTPGYCENCQGLVFNDRHHDNETLVTGLTGIIKSGVPGFYVFSAPWETTSKLMANIDEKEGYHLPLPTSYQGPNYIYAISIATSVSASLVTYNSNLTPGSGYPAPSPAPAISQCTEQTPPFTIDVTGGSGGAVVPAGINTNETVYMVRHAEAHPNGHWDDGNYVCAGQWRALDLPNALRGKISPDEVYSIDPAQVIEGTQSALGDDYSYVRPALTVEPYAIANNLPYDLAASFELDGLDLDSLQPAGNFFFFKNATGPDFSNHTVLVAWEHDHIPPTVEWLISKYYAPDKGPKVRGWPSDDYDTIWTVKLDAAGNLTVDNTLCEGIDSAKLPATCPQF